MYERSKQPVISRRSFITRILRHTTLAVFFILLGLGIGVMGYHYLCHLPWVDSLLNASMILGGMGPVDVLTDQNAKIFASCYALFSGLAFIGIASILIAPFVHRLMHRLHLDDD